MGYSIEVLGIGNVDKPAAVGRREVFDVTGRTDLAVAALGSLGLITDLDAAHETIGKSMQVLNDAVAAEHGDQPDIEPYVGIELPKGVGLTRLLTTLASQGLPVWGDESDEDLAK
ncbi:MAG TPA: hypothetical protein VK674_00610 [Candidatus Limnocylindria bacterium]|nr:hypothetical protein [Candidatus Limnocylindria bacterium]